MNRDISDDPRQVLAILNALGVVGVSAAELKAFMKELKIYRKEREKYKEQWKEETKIKLLLQQGYLKNHILNVLQPSSRENVPSNPEKKRNHRIKAMHNDYYRENTQQSCYKNQYSKNDEPRAEKFLHMINNEKSKDKVKIKTNNHLKENLKSQTDFSEVDNIKPLEIHDKSVKKIKQTSCAEKLEIPREPSAKSVKSMPSSVISSNKSGRPSSSLRSSKKIGSDPVTLYNQYKRYWSKLSFPGEEPHAKLRWAVRERMLGSEPNPKPR